MFDKETQLGVKPMDLYVARFLVSCRVMKCNSIFCATAAGLILLSSPLVHAANHYILPSATGSANGSDWNNAYGGIPNTLVRGDTYYIGAGNYGSHTFSSVSGTTYVYLKKATVGDHGTDTGWQASFGTGQAVFSSSSTVWVVHMSYLSVDGVTGAGTNGYGIKLVTTGTGQGSGATIYSYSTAPTGLILKHLECAAPDPNGNLSNFNIDCHVWPGPANELIQYCYIHGGLVGVLFTGSNQTLDHCYLRSFGGQQHAEVIDAANVQNLTIRYNVLEDLMSPNPTTYIEPQVNGGTVPNGIYIYGNVFRAVSTKEGCNNPAVFSSTSGEKVLNVFIYNNTFYGLHACSPSIGFADTGIRGDSASSTITVRNNIWQACVYNPGFQSVQVQDHNMLNTGGASFVNSAAGDFHLAANTSPGVNLGSPYDIDPDGRQRTTWSLGAYEYASASTNAVIQVSPTSQNSGPISVGATTNVVFTVKNIGNATLSGTASVPSPFSVVSGGSYNLGANQSQTVTVGFSPTASGNYSQTVTFAGGGGATASITSVATPPVPQGIRIMAGN